MAAKQILRDRKMLTEEIVVERAVYLLPEATVEHPHRITIFRNKKEAGSGLPLHANRASTT